ncbi:molybdopterin-binding protein [Ruminococcaceae bacterium OttesenSCG-928-A16]|nr:molybdopterin-binding protein [Ruminococcaceae bacterium OttesenSCG-928-A16]
MKLIKTTEAEGHVLCHDLTRIVKGESKDAAFRKGHVVTKADIPVLLSMGKENLYVWEKIPGMLHENEAAEILYALCAGEYMRATPVKEGKIEVVATVDGLLQVDVEKLRSINSLGQMMIATRHTNTPVKKADHLAGTRIIPLVIQQKKMQQAQQLAGQGSILTLHPYKAKKVGIVTTGTEVYNGLIKDTFTPVLKQKLAEYGAEVIGQQILPDDNTVVTAAILALIEKGANMVLCTGGMSVDPDDKTPLAIKNTGARVVSYGAPVLPGAMFMLAYYKGNLPVVGLPGCVMYAKRTIFDIVLPRLMADVPVSSEDLAALGHGGLCLNCDTCIYPACAFGAGV